MSPKREPNAPRMPDALMSALGIEAQVALFDGRLEEVVAMGDRIAARGEGLGLTYLGRMTRLWTMAWPLVYLGRAEELLAEEILAGGPEFTQYFERRGDWDQIQALLLAHAGKVEKAVELSRRYMAEGHYGEKDDETVTIKLYWMLDTAVRVGDRETAEVLYPRLAPLTDHAFINRTLGGAAALFSDIQGARAHYQAALEILAKIRHRPEIALTRLELAELLLDHYPDERAEALEHLDFAIAELRDMKMQPALERALSRREILKA